MEQLAGPEARNPTHEMFIVGTYFFKQYQFKILYDGHRNGPAADQ